jgi:hypothetical protein
MSGADGAHDLFYNQKEEKRMTDKTKICRSCTEAWGSNVLGRSTQRCDQQPVGQSTRDCQREKLTQGMGLQRQQSLFR